MNNKNLIRLVEGIKRIGRKKFCVIVPISYAILVVISWMIIKPLLPKADFIGISDIWSILFNIIMVEAVLVGEMVVLIALGTPLESIRIEKGLRRIKMCDDDGNTPLLLAKSKEGDFITYKFYSTTFSKDDFINRIANLRQVLKREVAKEWITEGEDPRYIIVETFSVKKKFHP